ncbi:MAG: phosphatase PAP2 family protein [Tannerellaceae bacterium]|jgi:membrane-associated phospholipid phosphatase|nr:phosphatase PAP2 family protein [Tannerellaceae bacterium]
MKFPACIIAIATACCLVPPATAQEHDEASFGRKAAPYIISGSLITYGILAHTLRPYRLIDESIDNKMKELNLHTRADDYIQYAPLAAIYGAELLGAKARHNLRDRTFICATSYLLTTLTVNALKYSVDIPRPTGSAHNSFPSGHTATAFTGAHILFREYKDSSPWIGIAGYAAAAGVGSMRVINRKHWLGDVAAGAGTAILCVEASYLLLPLFRKVIKAPSGMAIVPVVGSDAIGMGMACVF